MYKLTWNIPSPTEEGYIMSSFDLFFNLEEEAIKYKKHLVRSYKYLGFDSPSSYVTIIKIDVI